jgi:N-acetylmuramoyl-L-alanine amidase
LMRVAIDVQHAFKPWPLQNDRGAVFRLQDGTHVTEFSLAWQYATALAETLERAGHQVLRNAPGAQFPLTGWYSARARQAAAWRAQLYLACHVNAGGGSYALLSTAQDMSVDVPPSDVAAWSVSGRIATALRATGMVTAGKTAGLTVTSRGYACISVARRLGIPAVLVEPFFGDNPGVMILDHPAFCAEIGQAIAAAVIDYARATPGVNA